MALALAYLWEADLPSHSFFGLRLAIRRQLSELLALTDQLREHDDLHLPRFAQLDPISSLIGAIEAANTVFSQPERRWALLCDELEIAPKMIRTELFEMLRGRSKDVLFKLSLYPYSTELAGITGPDLPTTNNDYTPLHLSYGYRETAYEFCRSLFDGMLERMGAQRKREPEEILGDGWFDGGRSRRRQKHSPYAAPSGDYYRRAAALTKIDPSFERFLRSSGFNIKEIPQLPEGRQAVYRKALPFILTRSEFLRDSGIKKGRRASKLYTGAYSLFSISEGNPRIFINLMRPLIAEYLKTDRIVLADRQVLSAETTINRFRASLAAIPSAPYEDIKSVLDLVEVIGRHFEFTTIVAPFNAEPSTTFVVDAAVRPGLLELLGRAVNSGAFIVIPDERRPGVSDLMGARLRLAHTLAPEFKLPLALGRIVNLSRIIITHRAARHKRPRVVPQIILPFGES
ncbi:MAG TPA: hypothetical protein VMS43_08645 [Allosphingosinicella sp.]|nr:hypothetical protein [Allosphingosinicella sp.]